jgi:hypothetical protein
MDKYEKETNFSDELKKNVLDPLESLKISLKIVDQNVIKRICDLKLLYSLIRVGFPQMSNKFQKITGRALELVVESILKWKLENSLKLDYEFVDWNGFDYLIFDKTQYDWTVGIQCKVVLSSGYLAPEKALQSIKEPNKILPLGKKAIMFCGWVDKEEKKEKIRKAFESKNWGFYCLVKLDASDKIDKSFYEFIDAIEIIAKNQK